MMESVGWTGSLMLGICGIPAFYKVWKEGHAHGLSTMSVWLWFLGEVFTLAYILSMKELSFPLLANYGLNLVLVGGLVYYKLYPRSK